MNLKERSIAIPVYWSNRIETLGVFVLALIPRVIGLGTFWAADERYHWELSNNFLMAFLRVDWADTVPQGLPGVTLAWIESIGVLLRYGVAWLVTNGQVSLEQVMALDQPFAQLAQRQMVVVFVSTLIVVGVYQLAGRLFGARAALIGTMFVALDPFFLAESRVLRFEGLVAGLMTLSVLAALVYVRERHGYALCLSSMTAGLAALTKISAVLLIPVVGLIFLTLLPDWQRGAWLRAVWRAGMAFAIWSLMAALIFWAVWPAMWVSPVSTLQTVFNFAYEASEEGLEGRGVFFWGRIYPDDPGPWFYPVAFFFRVTPLVLLGAMVAVVLLIRDRRRAGPRLSDTYWTWWGLVALFVYAFFFAFAMTLGAKKYDRYLMPVFPVLDLVAGIGLVQISKVGRWLPFDIWYLILVVALVLQPLTALPHLPYFYTYYNPLLGGIHQAAKIIRVGFGEGLDIAARYLETKPDATKLKVASANSGKISPLFSGQTISLDNLDGRWVQADYVLIYISQVQRGKHDPAILDYLKRRDSEFVVTLHGFEYAWLYPGPAFQRYGGGTKLEGRGTLWGFDLSDEGLHAGDSLELRLIWRNEGQRPTDRFYVRLTDADNYIWADDIVHPSPGFEAAFRTRKAIVEGKASLSLPVGMPPGEYILKMGYEDAQTAQPIGEFVLPSEADDIMVTLPRVFPSLGGIKTSVPVNLVLQDELNLLGYEFDTDRVMPGEAMWLTLYWQALTDVSHDYVIALQLLDETGAEATYWLGRPVRSSYPTDQWRARQVMQDPWRLVMPPDLPFGRYSLALSVYDAATAQPVATTSLQPVWVTSDAD